MDEVWSGDGRRFEVYEDKGHPDEWSDDPVPELVKPEVLSGWGWRVAARSKDGRGSHRGEPDQPDSGAIYPSRKAARAEAIAYRARTPDLADLPVVDWLTGDSVEDEDEGSPSSN